MRYMFWLSPALLLLMTADAGAQNLDTAGLKNVCLGAQVEASSNASEPGGRFYCDKAVDGSVSTRWATADHQGPPQWLQVEFAEPTTLDTVVILQVDMPELYANAERMQLAFSAGEPVEATLEDTAAAQIVRLEPRTTTYLRLTITSSYGFEHYLGVRELMAFHDPERRVTVPAPPPPIPKPIPPVYEELKDLHLMTELVSDGRAAISIVKPASGIHDAAAAAIQDAIEEMTGVEVPIIDDRDPGAAVPIESNLIALGNRSTSRLISDLYDRMFTMLDLKYPGRGGYVVRTLHSPFGNGHNVIFVGGSDAEGVNSAAAALADKLREARTVQGKLNLGWTMQIELGEGMVVPEDLQEVRVWEASRQYGNRGTFGWNSISKRMALYHMTGDEHHAREFLRLAFPDEQALAELRRDDAGQIEVERDPLAGAYHYNAHMLIVFWDLIEESPVFTDAERLKVTNAFARQLRHRADDFTGLYYTTEPPVVSGDRHRDWEGVCLYLLGRYFQRDYPAPVWRRCIDAARLHFSSRYNPEGTCATNDHLFWYNTVIAPSLVWTILTDDQRALESGTIDRLLLGQEILSNGRASDWGLQAASLAFLNQAAYLTGDGRWLYYCNRLGLDTEGFRLGQSFWPDESLQPAPPTDLVDRWTVYEPSRPIWRQRDSGLPFEECFMFGSFRSDTGAGGDYVLLKDWNMASRNPYHTFDLLELRLAGCMLLKGYHNQVLTSADGLVEPRVAMNGALRHRDVVGEMAVAVGEVPDAPFCAWRRTLLQRTGRYALVIDELNFDADSDTMKARVEWEAIRSPRIIASGLAALTGEVGPQPGWLRVPALECQWTASPGEADVLEKRPGADAILFSPQEAGSWVETTFELAEPISGELYVDLHNYRDRGRLRLLIDGQAVGTIEHYAPLYERVRRLLGEVSLSPGEHSLRVEVTGKHADSEGLVMHLIGLTVRPEDSPMPPQSDYRLCSADALKTTNRGRILSMD